MAAIKFYNVKKRASVSVDESKCCKVVYKKKTSKGTQGRYAVRAKDNDDTNLTKFINKKTYDALKCACGK